ncbi:MAG: peptidoglycan-binding protein [Actinomycetia bacterium]|nr:peptidoglycan-binding protein [Actinomycetes bacterium]
MSTLIERGARGPGVEDIQKRLLRLGYDLGASGVDGVFLGATFEAVRSFQRARSIAEDGAVGPETWSALVDATFALGDRLLYLRFPHFHGADVATLQGALNALGFACGAPDGIFGAFTERAVREFQLNTGYPADGIVGSDTVRAVMRLRHVWEDKDPTAPVALAVAPARAADVLSRTRIQVHPLDEQGRAVAERLANLAVATEPTSRVEVRDAPSSERDVLLHIGSKGAVDPESLSIPIVRVGIVAQDTVEARLMTALTASEGHQEALVELGELAEDEQAMQRLAVRLLDAVCLAVTSGTSSVLS